MQKAYSYIRFSTPDQLKGSSLERQMMISEKYAQQHGLQIDQSLSLRDLGLSAFKGDHRTKGALGKFLELIEQGQIEKGSVLLIESLDRLSREQILDALGLFTNIINAGITIVTLSDGMEYSRETITDNWSQLIISLTIMSRAHEESKTKSQRVSKAWEIKRSKACGKKLTAKCPAWLTLNEDKADFLIIEGRDKIIEQIFQMKLEGKGPNLIAKELNNNGTAWIPKNGWRNTYINKILRNRSVIGEFQPHIGTSRSRKPVGDPIPNYYPSVVSDEVFYQVQEQLKRNKHHGGKNGKCTNLFGHIAKCGYCGGPMRFEDKGPPPKGSKYLSCDNARRGVGCKARKNIAVRYETFERNILLYCRGLNVEDIIPSSGEHASDLKTAKDKLSSIVGQISHSEDKIAAYFNDLDTHVKDEQVRKLVYQKIHDEEQHKTDIEKEKHDVEQIISHLESLGKTTQENIDSVRGLIDLLNDGDTSPDLRLKTKEHLKNLINRIEVYSYGTKGKPVYPVDYLLREGAIGKKRYDSIEGSMLLYMGSENQTYRIYFKSGVVREIRPRKERTIVVEYQKGTTNIISRIWAFDHTGKVIAKTKMEKGKSYEFDPMRISQLVARDFEYGYRG